MLRLPAWGIARTEFLVDPETGAWSSRERAPLSADDIVLGFGSIEPVWLVRRVFYAFYAFQGRLYLQAGKRRWDVTDGLAYCKFWAAGFGLASGLILKFNNGETHRPVLVHPSRALSAVLDPTYDDLDLEDDHFFLFLRENLPNPSWRRGFINRSIEVEAPAG